MRSYMPGSRRMTEAPERGILKVPTAFGCFKNISIFVGNTGTFFLTAKTTNVAYENNDKKLESIYSKRIRAGKRRTYFFDVRATRGNDYYLTITESRKRFDDNGYDRHKVFLYKEDFNKFIKALNEAVDYVKTDLMPDFDFDAFNHDEMLNDNEGESINEGQSSYMTDTEAPYVRTTAAAEVAEPVETEATIETAEAASEIEPVTATASTEEVDKW